MMNGQLLCRVRIGVTLKFKLREESVIGCDKGLEVVVPVEGVSGKHAKIVFDGASYWIEDLKSPNGTFLNGQAVTRNRLRHLDVITLGKADLVFVVRAAEAAPPQRVLAIVRAALVPEEPEAAPYEIAPGEITIGRAPSNNLVVEEGAVSKVHARIERTRDQLVLEDLGSANGTFVNGARLTAAFLKDGDAVSLGNVETFRIVIEMGEVTSASGRHAAVAAGGSATGRLRFSAEWKTRLDWSSGEREEPAGGAAAPPVKPAAPAATVKAAGPIATVRLTGARTNLSVARPGAYTIGRSGEVELRVDHPSVSRRHARLILSDDRAMVYLQDQGGANGTRHNGKEVENLAPLADGDTIGIGEVDLKVELDRG